MHKDHLQPSGQQSLHMFLSHVECCGTDVLRTLLEIKALQLVLALGVTGLARVHSCTVTC